jgi:hypothetical protein
MSSLTYQMEGKWCDLASPLFLSFDFILMLTETHVRSICTGLDPTHKVRTIEPAISQLKPNSLTEGKPTLHGVKNAHPFEIRENNQYRNRLNCFA